MSFNENTFIIAGTAIAMAGFGLYLWDTRVSKRVGNLASGFRGNSQQQVQQQGYQYSPYGPRDSLDSRNSYSFGGKSKKNKASEMHKKTKKRNK